ncbi:hypothetical protein CYMTET_11090 [Cymbomonas tetramitiformis]|uniref:Uncharacterized protein n=1 Tax=Cymbomonas tetramitiformis TaxID=36881 RepID=A0AAE0GNE7_9CHLO|nr:hypothetical protein CYMTET_11090 [Cymbomonas tetramitiformis]
MRVAPPKKSKPLRFHTASSAVPQEHFAPRLREAREVAQLQNRLDLLRHPQTGDLPPAAYVADSYLPNPRCLAGGHIAPLDSGNGFFNATAAERAPAERAWREAAALQQGLHRGAPCRPHLPHSS